MCEMEEHSQTGSHRLCRWRDIRAIFADEYQNLVVPRATAPQRQVESHTIELCPQHKVANESCTVASEPARHSVFALAIHSRLRRFLAGSLVAFRLALCPGEDELVAGSRNAGVATHMTRAGPGEFHCR